MVGVIANVLHTPVHVIERWPPDKTRDYFDTAIEVQQLMNGRAAPEQGDAADPAMDEKIMDALGFKL